MEEVAGNLLHWLRVAIEAVSAVERVRGGAGSRLDGRADSVAAAVSTAEMTDGTVADAVEGTDRSQREVSEAGTSVQLGAEHVERSARYAEQTVGRWRASGGRPLQLAELGNDAVGQAGRRLSGCLVRSRALADRVASATSTGDALESNAAENQALACAWRARERGESVLERLRASSRVDAASDEGWRRTDRGVTRLTGQAEALRHYDQPMDRGR